MFQFLARNFSNPALASEEDIRSAYRLLLDRAPDAEGLQHHLRWARSNKATPVQLADRFLASAEFKQRTQTKNELMPVEMDGYTVFARRGDRLIGEEVINGAPYEPNVSGEFKKALGPGFYVLDVGANIGMFALLAAANVGESGRIIAVEPLRQNHRALYAGIVRNRFSNVQVLPFAASDKAGLISVRCAPDSSNGIVGADEGSTDPDAYVPTQRLEDVLSTLPRLDIIKMDIEGHEPAAWRGMKALVEKHRPSIFSEFSPIAMRNVGQDASEYLAMLLAYSSRIRVLHRDTEIVECGDSQSVMHEWREANRRAGMDGELHLDLHIVA